MSAWSANVGASGRSTRGLPPFALELFYVVRRFIPRPLQLAMRRRLIARQGEPAFPRVAVRPCRLPIWCGSRSPMRCSSAAWTTVRFPWFWPDGAKAAVTLTHDVESADGLARAATVAGWEEQHGFRSSFNIVSDWYPIDDRAGGAAERPGP